MAIPSPILRCMSRPRSTALRLTQGHTGGAAAPRWARGRSRGAGWPLNFLSAFHGGGTKRLFELPIRPFEGVTITLLALPEVITLDGRSGLR